MEMKTRTRIESGVFCKYLDSRIAESICVLGLCGLLANTMG